MHHYLLQQKAIKEELLKIDYTPLKLIVSNSFLYDWKQKKFEGIHLEGIETNNYLYLEIVKKTDSVKDVIKTKVSENVTTTPSK